MAEDDLRALVDSLDDASQEDLAKVIANFSVDMLQRASALIGAQLGNSGGQLRNRTQECLQQQQREEVEVELLASGGKRVSPQGFGLGEVGACPSDEALIPEYSTYPVIPSIEYLVLIRNRHVCQSTNIVIKRPTKPCNVLDYRSICHY